MFGLPDLLHKRGTPRPYICMILSRSGQTRGAAPTVGGVLNLSPLSTLHSQLTLNTKLSTLNSHPLYEEIPDRHGLGFFFRNGLCVNV